MLGERNNFGDHSAKPKQRKDDSIGKTKVLMFFIPIVLWHTELTAITSANIAAALQLHYSHYPVRHIVMLPYRACANC